MKRFVSVLASLCLVCACAVVALLPATAFARMATGVGGWSWQNPLPQGNGYTGGYFLDATHGWLISGGTIFHTADGGVTLTVQARHKNVRFSAITFVGAKHGWAVGPPTSGSADVLYRTVDGGRTWTRVPLPWSGGINGVSFATTEVGWATLVHSILRTTDGGLHWTMHALSKRDKTLGVQALSSRRAWVADGDTLLRTLDGGATWKHVAAGSATHLNVVCFTSSQSGWAGAGSYRGAGQIVHTTDGGLHWDLQLATQGVTALSFADSSNGWATAGTVYGTTDGGTDWAPQDTAPFATWVLALTPLGAVIGNAGTSVGLSHTSDGGATWQSSTRAAGDYSGKLNDLQFVNTRDGWAVGSGGGILATTDGGATWEAEDSTITADLNRVHFIDATNGWAVGDQGAIVNTTDGGAHWAAQTSGTDYDLTGVTFTDAQDGWATGQTFDQDDYSSGVILHTTDGGQDWTTQLASLFDPSKQNPGVAFGGVAFNDAQHGWAVGETQGSDSTLNLTVIMHTTDGGTAWKRQLYFMPANVSNADDATLSSVACTDARHAVAVGYDENRTEIWRTTNGGTTWTRIGQKLWPLFWGANLTDVVFTDATHGWAVGPNGVGDTYVIHTTDGGATWTKQLIPNDVASLDALSFVSRTHGWAAGGGAAILVTTTGGSAP